MRAAHRLQKPGDAFRSGQGQCLPKPARGPRRQSIASAQFEPQSQKRGRSPIRIRHAESRPRETQRTGRDRSPAKTRAETAPSARGRQRPSHANGQTHAQPLHAKEGKRPPCSTGKKNPNMPEKACLRPEEAKIRTSRHRQRRENKRRTPPLGRHGRGGRERRSRSATSGRAVRQNSTAELCPITNGMAIA